MKTVTVELSGRDAELIMRALNILLNYLDNIAQVERLIHKLEAVKQNLCETKTLRETGEPI